MVNTRASKEIEQTSERGRTRGRGRPRKYDRGGQPSRVVSSDPPSVGAEVEVSQENVPESHSQSVTPVSVDPAQAQSQGPGISELVGIITQAVVAAVGASSSQQSRNLEAERNVERARKLGATEFQGTTDPIQAASWLRRIERVFDVMGCSEEQRLSIATFLLEGRAQNWWRSVSNRQPLVGVLTWEGFKKEFYQQYYSEVYRIQKRREFLSLTQGKMSVADYEATFVELSQFAETLLVDEREKCRLFQDGLNLPIKAKASM